MIKWIFDNKEWIFGGIGVVVLITAAKYLIPTIKYLALMIWKKNETIEEKRNIRTITPEKIKSNYKILFIDDQKFKVVEILKEAGWTNTKIIDDINSLDDFEITSTNLFFVDILGVGKSLGFKDEGLGLVEAIKEKYPDKKVVIYSAENEGDRFHKALNKVDSSLRKNADPYEFLRLVEQFSEYNEYNEYNR